LDVTILGVIDVGNGGLDCAGELAKELEGKVLGNCETKGELDDLCRPVPLLVLRGCGDGEKNVTVGEMGLSPPP
jgi:hypothetical protein